MNSSKEWLRQATICQSPVRLVIILTFSIFFFETLSHILSRFLQPVSKMSEAILDSTLLIGLLSPMLYYFMLLPLNQFIADRKRAEDALRKAHDELEIRVQERTAELEDANEALQSDITERKRMEEQLIEQTTLLRHEIIERKIAENALRKAYEELEVRVQQRTAELAKSNEELEQFAYVASHDLQEPLRMIASFTQLLEKRYKGKLDKDADEFMGFVVDGATRMQNMINDLLAYSRVGTRGKPFEPTDCKAVLDMVLANLKVAIEENKAVITHDPLPAVMADDLQMVQLFQNLLSNAIKFRKRDELPRVHFSAEKKGEEWVFSVKDSGIGIAPEYHDRLFMMFQRFHREYPGTGMGLAICKKIVERHGGRIWVESEPRKGSIFYFTIPVKE